MPPTDSPAVALLVGTTKGAFVLRADAGRAEWQVDGPFLRGEAVYAMALDTRGGRRRLWAAKQSMHWGAVLAHSDDFGATWTVPVLVYLGGIAMNPSTAHGTASANPRITASAYRPRRQR